MLFGREASPSVDGCLPYSVLPSSNLPLYVGHTVVRQVGEEGREGKSKLLPKRPENEPLKRVVRFEPRFQIPLP